MAENLLSKRDKQKFSHYTVLIRAAKVAHCYCSEDAN